MLALKLWQWPSPSYPIEVLIYLLVTYGVIALGAYFTLRGIFNISARKIKPFGEAEIRTPPSRQPWEAHVAIIFCVAIIAIVSSYYLYISAGMCTGFLCGVGEAILTYLVWTFFFVFSICYLIASRKNSPGKAFGVATVFAIIIILLISYVRYNNIGNNIGAGRSEMDQAYLAQKISTCEEFSDQKAKAYCYLNVAKSKKDSSICEKIPTEDFFSSSTDYRVPDMRDDCFSELARGDLLVCDKINDPTKKDYCYSSVAKTKRDHSACGVIQDQKIKDECYLFISITKQDPSVCDNIQDESNRRDCSRGSNCDQAFVADGKHACLEKMEYLRSTYKETWTPYEYQ